MISHQLTCFLVEDFRHSAMFNNPHTLGLHGNGYESLHGNGYVGSQSKEEHL